MTAIIKPEFESLLVSDEFITTPNTDSIAPTEFIKSQAGKTIELEVVDITTLTSELHRAICTSTIVFNPVGKNDLIHISWLKSIEGIKVKAKPTIQGKFIDFSTTHYIDRSTNTLVEKSAIQTCSVCGSVLDTNHTSLCSKCLIKKYYDVKSYSFKPTPIFNGSPTNAKETANPIYYGIELEYGLESQIDIATLVESANGGLYLKSDGSIRGGAYQVEMVSHPYTYQELINPSSWIHRLPKDAVDKPESNGCHVHISRTAFQSDRHYAKFKHLILSNQAILEAVGGRALTSYCKINSGAKHIILSQKDKIGDEKYFLVNEVHKDTIELRFMASTNNTEQLLRYLQYIHTMIKYTSYNVNTASYEGYATYVLKYAKTYSILADFIKENLSLFTVGKVSYTQKSYVVKNIYDIPLRLYSNIIKVNIKDGPDTKEILVSDFAKVAYHMDNSTGKFTRFCDYNLSPDHEIMVTMLRGA